MDIIQEDLELLQQGWINEKCSPEILVYEEGAVENIQALLREKEDAIIENSGDVDGSFASHLMQLEIDRIKFLLRSYLRARLDKITKYSLYVTKNDSTFDRLSPAEKTFVTKYVEAYSKHFNTSFLSHIPASLRTLDTDTEQMKMVPTPNLDTFVFFRVLEDVGLYQVSYNNMADEVSLSKGDIYIARYLPMRPLLRENKVVLI
eukprot:GCRY01002998.1.p1 GENE.GCRY01002998.1~~GCRY01002998.1.p1  ORF type:complete len:204 (+),score=23.25 GCRY01002998.1:107-718(+)